MNMTQHFLAYADAFEVAVETNDWTKVAEYFSENAEYIAIDGECSVGKNQIIDYLRGSVANIDRKFDTRLVKPLQPEIVADNQLFMKWANTFAISGAPELTVSGSAKATYEGSQIVKLHDALDDGVAEQLGSWMQEHGSKLAQ